MTCELEDTGGALDFQSLLSLFFPHTVFFFSFFMIFKFRKITFHLENLNKEHLHVLDPDSPVFTRFVTFASLFSLLFWLAFSTHTHTHAHGAHTVLKTTRRCTGCIILFSSVTLTLESPEATSPGRTPGQARFLGFSLVSLVCLS